MLAFLLSNHFWYSLEHNKPPIVQGGAQTHREAHRPGVTRPPQSRQGLARDGEGFQEADPVARTLSLVLGDIENACLMFAAACVETLGLHVATFVFDGFMVKDPEGRISAANMRDRVF